MKLPDSANVAGLALVVGQLLEGERFSFAIMLLGAGVWLGLMATGVWLLKKR